MPGAEQELFISCALHTGNVRNVELVPRPHIHHHSRAMILQAGAQRCWAQAIIIAQQMQLRRCGIVGLSANKCCVIVGGQRRAGDGGRCATRRAAVHLCRMSSLSP